MTPKTRFLPIFDLFGPYWGQYCHISPYNGLWGASNDPNKGSKRSKMVEIIDLAMCGFDGFGVCHTTVILALFMV